MNYLITIAAIAISFTLATAAMASASNVGQTGPDENGMVVCYYTNHNTGAQYVKTALYVCPSQ